MLKTLLVVRIHIHKETVSVNWIQQEGSQYRIQEHFQNVVALTSFKTGEFLIHLLCFLIKKFISDGIMITNL